MRIGYACQALGVPGAEMRGCLIRNAGTERLMDIIWNNLNSLENIVEYNIANDIRLFRISSDLIPFGSNPVNRLPWWDMYSSWMQTIGAKIVSGGMRVSMHPGQYTVLNSTRDDIVDKAVDDLVYHTRVLDNMNLGAEHKIILHVGGVYHDKKQSMERFMRNYSRLSENIRKRLVIENDDKCFSAEDCLNISEKLGIPVVFDILHNVVNPCETKKNETDWIELCQKTWSSNDGAQKIHYSQQAPGKNPGSHSTSINPEVFLDFYNSLKNKDIDIMLEVKDKNLSAIKCIGAIRENARIFLR